MLSATTYPKVTLNVCKGKVPVAVTPFYLFVFLFFVLPNFPTLLVLDTGHLWVPVIFEPPRNERGGNWWKCLPGEMDKVIGIGGGTMGAQGAQTHTSFILWGHCPHKFSYGVWKKSSGYTTFVRNCTDLQPSLVCKWAPMMFTLFLFNHKRKFKEESTKLHRTNWPPLFYDVTTRVCCKILDYRVIMWYQSIRCTSPNTDHLSCRNIWITVSVFWLVQRIDRDESS